MLSSVVPVDHVPAVPSGAGPSIASLPNRSNAHFDTPVAWNTPSIKSSSTNGTPKQSQLNDGCYGGSRSRSVGRARDASFRDFVSEELGSLLEKLVFEHDTRIGREILESRTTLRRTVPDDDPFGNFLSTESSLSLGVTASILGPGNHNAREPGAVTQSWSLNSIPVGTLREKADRVDKVETIILSAVQSAGPSTAPSPPVSATGSSFAFALRAVWKRSDERTSEACEPEHPKNIFGTFKMRPISKTFSDGQPHGRSPTLHPESLLRFAWDLICGLLVMYECFTVPLVVFNPPETPFTEAMVWIMRLFWTMDLFMSSITGYILSNGQAEMCPLKVLKHYCRTWLSFDLSLVVADWLEVLVTSVRMAKAGRIMRVVRLGRVLRLIRVKRSTFVVLEHSMNRSHVEIVGIAAALMRMVLFLVWLNHTVACCWYGLSDSSANVDAHSNWISMDGIDGTPLSYRYFTSLHFALALFVGADVEVRPYNIIERIFTDAMLLCAFVVVAVVVSSLTTTMTHLEIAAAQDSRAMDNLRQFLADNNISLVLTQRVMRNAKHAILEEKRTKPNIEILRLIAEPLRVELHFEVYCPTLQIHPFFLSYSELSPEVVRRICHTAIRRLFMTNGDALFNAGEVPTVPSMFLFGDGMFHYSRTQKAPEAASSAGVDRTVAETGTSRESPLVRESTHTVLKGQWACEAVLWCGNWVHCGLLFVDMESTLLAVDAEQFQEVVEKAWNPAARNVCMYANRFVGRLNGILPSDLTDLGPAEIEVRDMVTETCPSSALALAYRRGGRRFMSAPPFFLS